jgi:adenylate cyclase
MDRRLAAILVADMVGYSHRLEADEAGTLAALKARRAEILQPLIERKKGRIVKLMGDGILLEFASAVNAVECAVSLQAAMALANEPLTKDKQIIFRVGLNLGEVVVEADDIFGDGVNVASRLEALCEPGGVWLSESVHRQVRGKIDLSFEDLGEHWLKNVDEPVRAYRVSSKPTVNEQIGINPEAPLRLSIAVLPFTNMSGDPAQQYLSDGITEDIITELSRFRNLSVASRHASFHLSSTGASLAETARALRANYVIEGSVRKTAERIRITVQLIDAKTGDHVWSERYDRECHDIFSVQDQVVSAIVATLEGRIVAAGAALARKRPTAYWSAYDCLLQGRELSNYFREREAVPFFARATTIDPGFAGAHAWLGLALAISYLFDAQDQTLIEAARAARRALDLDGNDATAHWANAMVLLWSRQHERAGLHFDRAIALNPADLQMRADRANWLRYRGSPDQALVAINDTLKQGPFAPQWFEAFRGEILFDLMKYGESINALNNIIQQSHISYVYLAAAYGSLGDQLSASQALAKAMQLKPNLSVQELANVLPYADSKPLDHLLHALRRIGMR